MIPAALKKTRLSAPRSQPITRGGTRFILPSLIDHVAKARPEQRVVSPQGDEKRFAVQR